MEEYCRYRGLVGGEFNSIEERGGGNRFRMKCLIFTRTSP